MLTATEIKNNEVTRNYINMYLNNEHGEFKTMLIVNFAKGIVKIVENESCMYLDHDWECAHYFNEHTCRTQDRANTVCFGDDEPEEEIIVKRTPENVFEGIEECVSDYEWKIDALESGCLMQ